MTRATLSKIVEYESAKLLTLAEGTAPLSGTDLEALEVLARVVKILGPDPIVEPEQDEESTLQGDLDLVAR